jgi:hypothetical protein
MNRTFGKFNAISQLFFWALMLLFTATSCKSKDKMADTQPATDTQSTTAAAIDSLKRRAEVTNSRDSLVVSFEKTACFGRCPVYKIKVYQSGFATYEGINFVDRMGLYYTRFDLNQIQEIQMEAREEGFFEFEETYDREGLTDLPSTTLGINAEGNRNKVEARFEIPKQVNTFFAWVENKLEQNPWKPYTMQ